MNSSWRPGESMKYSSVITQPPWHGRLEAKVYLHWGTSHLQVQMTSWSVPSELPFAAVLPWPPFLGLAGFIHHTRQVYTPRPEAQTANKLPWHVDCLPYLTLEASRVLFPITTNTSNYRIGLSGTIFLVFHSAHCDLGCLNDTSLGRCFIPLRCTCRCLCSYRICFITTQT